MQNMKLLPIPFVNQRKSISPANSATNLNNYSYDNVRQNVKFNYLFKLIA